MPQSMSYPDPIELIEEVSRQRDVALDGYERCLSALGEALDLVAQYRAERDALRARCDHLDRCLSEIIQGAE